MVFQPIEAFVALASINIENLVIFYINLLGKPKKQISNVYAEFQLPGLRLGIFRPKETNLQEFESAKSRISLCLEVTDLESAIAHLTNARLSPTRRNYHSISRQRNLRLRSRRKPDNFTPRG